jgi:hypothetical protein
MLLRHVAWSGVALLALTQTGAAQSAGAYEGLIASHAAAHGLPPSLVRRVILRESRFNPRAVSKGNYGLMQIRLGTARGMGYTGSAAGLLDANTNMTYAVKYLAGAYRVAGGNENLAIAYYQRGYYYEAKRKGMAHRSGRIAVPTSSPGVDVASLFDSSPQPATRTRRTRRTETVTVPSVTAETAAPARVTRVRQSRRAQNEPDVVTSVVDTVSGWFADDPPRRKARRGRRS